LEELHTTSFTSFVRTLEQQVRRLSDRIEPPPSELSPVLGITKIMGLLRDVLAATSVAEQRKQDISQVMQNHVKFEKSKSRETKNVLKFIFLH
jgi:hypothetical protein